MTNSSNHSLPVTEQDDTKAGNYFVSNYPPYSFWTEDRVGDALAALDKPPAPGNPLGIYIHIPFCRKRCHFCYFRVYTDKNSSQIREYLDAVVAEMSMYMQRACIGGRKPKFIYFGGGTPSYLSAKQLTYLTDALKKQLPWDETQEIAFECEPGTLNESKLNALRDFGVTRLSLGIENFSDHVLELNNRAHLSPEIHTAYDYARKIDFPQINIDLIAGMLGETEDNWFDCVDKTIAMAPECVTIYQMEIPYNTTIYQQMKTEGKEIAPVANWSTKRRWVSDAFDRLEAAGYTVTSAYTAVKDPEAVKFVYRDALWSGADMVGLGVSSFSHVNGTHYQNNHHYEPYIESIKKGELPILRALPINDEQKMIRELILQMKLGHVSRRYFDDKFGVDIFDRFAQPLKLHDQYFTLGEQEVRVSRDGLLQVDRLLHDFFLPEHRDARYA